MSEKGEDYQVAFIEGSCTRQSDEARLQANPPASCCGGCPGHLRSPGRRECPESTCTPGRSPPVSFMVTRPSSTKRMMPARSRPSSRWILLSRAARSTGMSFWLREGLCWVRNPLSRIIRSALNASSRRTPACITMGKTCMGPVTRAGLQSHLPDLWAIMRSLPRLYFTIPTTARCAMCWPSMA